MASAGMTDELKELFDSVAEDLGWLNIDGTKKALEIEIPTASKVKTKHKTKRAQVKKKTTKNDEKKEVTGTRKKSSKSSDDTCSQVAETPITETKTTKKTNEETPSTKKSYREETSFKEYRNVETPEKRYSSESSDDDDKFENFLSSTKSSFQTSAKPPPSKEEVKDFVSDDDAPIVISSSDDDDDKFENFLAAIKSSSQTAATRSPPSQEEMDDFIADDDEPIEISSDDDEEEQDDAVFYYQCNNAQPFSDEEGESVFTTPLEKPTKPKENKKPPSRISKEHKPDDTLFFTPMERPLKPKSKFKKPPSSFWEDDDSDDDFLTPLEKSLKAKKLKKPTSKSVEKDQSDDSVFVTPSVRLPLKPKTFKPPNTLPAKPSRPALSDNHIPQSHGIRSTPSFLSSLSTPVKGEYSSSPYIREFKKNKEALTTKLFKLYNETVFDNKLPSDLAITWNKRLRKTAGYCYYSKSKVGERRQARLELSEKVCDSAERLRDTLIHELCHAAAWLVHGVHDGHGRYWKYWAAKANIAHPEIPVIKRCHSYEINTKYKYQCTRCQTIVGRHSKSIDTEKYCCAYCQGQLVLLPPTNKDGTPAKPRAPSKFAMFVKENYGSTKKLNTKLKHADIMRLLSKDFANKAEVAE